jgi:hypothetical protein
LAGSRPIPSALSFTSGFDSMRTQKVLIALIGALFLWPLFTSVVIRPFKSRLPFLKSFDPDLSGAEVDIAPPHMTFSAVLANKFQTEAASWFDHGFGGRGFLIKVNNQIDYWAFSKSRMTTSGILIAREKWLFETNYSDEWLGKGDHPIDPAAIETFARKIAVIQRRLHLLGKPMILLISPSKAAVYPEYLPSVELEKRPQGLVRAYDHFVPALTRADVKFVDGNSVLKNAKARFDQAPLFCRGGTHWNALGAYLVTEQIFAEFEKQGMAVPRMNLERVDVDYNPRGSDRDLAKLLNLAITPDRFLTPHPITRIENAGSIGKMNICSVGGSFTRTILEMMASTDCMSDLLYLYYYKSRINFLVDPNLRIPLKDHPLDFDRDVLGADCLVLELNEVSAGKPGYILKFLSDLEDHIGVEESGGR